MKFDIVTFGSAVVDVFVDTDIAEKNKFISYPVGSKILIKDLKFDVGGGGTNTFGYYLSNGGVVTSTLSIPLRYMHTPNEMVNLDDVETTINYYVELLKSIKYQHNFKLV